MGVGGGGAQRPGCFVCDARTSLRESTGPKHNQSEQNGGLGWIMLWLSLHLQREEDLSASRGP